jgi:hypothetical protein
MYIGEEVRIEERNEVRFRDGSEDAIQNGANVVATVEVAVDDFCSEVG